MSSLTDLVIFDKILVSTTAVGHAYHKRAELTYNPRVARDVASNAANRMGESLPYSIPRNYKGEKRDSRFTSDQHPPLLFKVTVYRGETTVATVDWVLAVILGVLIYSGTKYERVNSSSLPWFFHDDYGYVVVLLVKFLALSLRNTILLSAPIILTALMMSPLANLLVAKEPIAADASNFEIGVALAKMFVYFILVPVGYTFAIFALGRSVSRMYKDHMPATYKVTIQKIVDTVMLKPSTGYTFCEGRMDTCATIIGFFVGVAATTWCMMLFFYVPEGLTSEPGPPHQ
ncbi:hypothetical protein OF83DRAFT_1284635 [Amylostereum chailletii]|nr:hypothetical protein OF83DRAFT_1284635 [Amylostereum chailletii]